MTTNTSEKGLETLIMRHMTGTDGLRPGREIELLREYRTRLVADVVTGKLDVRPAARQLSAESLALEPAPVADSLDETGDLGETQTEET